jgi:hypothetical protein
MTRPRHGFDRSVAATLAGGMVYKTCVFRALKILPIWLAESTRCRDVIDGVFGTPGNALSLGCALTGHVAGRPPFSGAEHQTQKLADLLLRARQIPWPFFVVVWATFSSVFRARLPARTQLVERVARVPSNGDD